MHVPLKGCLNMYQLLLKGQGLQDCIWLFKIYSWTFLEFSHAGGQGPKGSVHREAHKVIHSVGFLAPQASTHCHPLFQMGRTTVNGCWVWGLSELWPCCWPSRCFTLVWQLGGHTRDTCWVLFPLRAAWDFGKSWLWSNGCPCSHPCLSGSVFLQP